MNARTLLKPLAIGISTTTVAIAAKDSAMSHIAIIDYVDGNNVTWME